MTTDTVADDVDDVAGAADAVAGQPPATGRRDICCSVASAAFLWGTGAMDAQLDGLRRLQFWRFALEPLQVRADNHQVGGVERSLGFLSNCQAILPTLQSASSKATRMLRASAYLHQYERYGVGREEMSEALLSLLQVQNDYEKLR